MSSVESSPDGRPIEKERTFLGMTHNPFSKPDQGFFDRGDRKTHLEQLRHLSHWSRRVLLVTGPEGVGKTSLYRQLSASLEPRVKAARVNAALINTSHEVVMAIARGFGLAAPADANVQLLKSLIEDHVSEQEKGGRQCVVLIDDAQLLEPRAIDELINLADRSGLRMVLFGEVRLVTGIERAADRAGVGWHEIRLSGYGEADTREYLEWRFRQVRYRGRIPFTDQQVKEIVRLSEGLPGRINQMANVLLVKLESGGFGQSRPGFPRLHTSLLILLIILTTLGWVLFTDDGGDETPAEVVKVPLPAPAVGSTKTAADTGSVVSGPAPVGSAASAARQTAGTDSVEAAASATAEVAEQPTSLAGRDVTSSAAAPVVPGRAAVVSESRPAPTVAASGPSPAVSAVPQSQTPIPAPKPAPSAAGGKDGRWLLEQPPGAYTVQLVTLSSAERAAAFVAEQAEPQRFATYQLARDGRTLHVVVYGVFDSKAEAERAARALTGSAAKVKPWIRTLAQVHTAIRTVQRQ